MPVYDLLANGTLIYTGEPFYQFNFADLLGICLGIAGIVISIIIYWSQTRIENRLRKITQSHVDFYLHSISFDLKLIRDDLINVIKRLKQSELPIPTDRFVDMVSTALGTQIERRAAEIQSQINFIRFNAELSITNGCENIANSLLSLSDFKDFRQIWVETTSEEWLKRAQSFFDISQRTIDTLERYCKQVGR